MKGNCQNFAGIEKHSDLFLWVDQNGPSLFGLTGDSGRRPKSYCRGSGFILVRVMVDRAKNKEYMQNFKVHVT